MTLTVSRGDEATRSEFTEVNGNLVANWTAGDKLLVFDYSGNKLGYLSLEENASGAYTNTETFSGLVTLSDNSKGVGIAYLGASHNDEVATYNKNFYEYDLSSQDGSFASMAANDCLAAEGEATIGNDGVATVATPEGGNIVMKRRIAFGHFKISGTDAPTLKAGDEIVISANKMANTAKVYLNNGGSIITPGTSSKYYGDITIKLTQDPANNDFYVTMVPYGNSAKFNPTFTVKTSDGKTYSSEALGDHTWKYGEYVHSGVNGAPKEVTVTPDDDGSIKWVDLGLPSGILWGDRNLGATYNYEYGNLVGWGDVTMSKTSTLSSDYPCPYNMNSTYYQQNYYKNCAGNNKYDVSTYVLGNGFYTPDMDDWDELFENCTQSYETLTGSNSSIKVMKLTSDINGNYIYLPLAGNRSGTEIQNRGQIGYYWSAVFCLWFGGKYHDKTGVYYYFQEQNGNLAQCSNIYTPMGMSIRPIKY